MTSLPGIPDVKLLDERRDWLCSKQIRDRNPTGVIHSEWLFTDLSKSIKHLSKATPTWTPTTQTHTPLLTPLYFPHLFSWLHPKSPLSKDFRQKNLLKFNVSSGPERGWRKDAITPWAHVHVVMEILKACLHVYRMKCCMLIYEAHHIMYLIWLWICPTVFHHSLVSNIPAKSTSTMYTLKIWSRAKRRNSTAQFKNIIMVYQTNLPNGPNVQSLMTTNINFQLLTKLWKH